MKKTLLLAFSLSLLLTSCGTSTSSIDEIRERLEVNKCRMNREELIFQIKDQEYLQDTTYTEIPGFLLEDSIFTCPSNGLYYTLVWDGDDRSIECPSGHGDSSF